MMLIMMTMHGKQNNRKKTEARNSLSIATVCVQLMFAYNLAPNTVNAVYTQAK